MPRPTSAALRSATAAIQRAVEGLGARADAVLVVLVGALYIYVRATSPFDAVGGDGHYTYLWVRSLVFDRDLTLDNDFALCGDPWSRGYGPTRHALNQWPMGPALLWAPFLAVARRVVELPRGAGTAFVHACRGPWAAAAMMGSAVAGALTLALAGRVTRRHAGPLGAAAGVLVVGVGSALMHYAVFAPSYSHVHAALGVALFVERWDAWRARMTLLRAAGLGLCLGFAMMMRPQSFALVLLPAADTVVLLADRARRGDPRAWGRAVLAWTVLGLAALALFWPQFWAWRHMYGRYFVVPQGPRYMRWAHPHFTGLLFSTYNGLLVATPMLYPAVAALLALPFWKRHRGLAPLTGLFLAVWYVNASVWDYWGEASFSARRMTELAAPFALGVGLVTAALARLAARRPGLVVALCLGPLVLLGAAWNVGAMRGVANGRTLLAGERLAPELWNPTFDLAFTPLWEALGNPLAWPASLPWALRYRTHPRAFDRIVGVGFFKHRYTDGRPEPGTDTFPIGNWDEYFPEGFSEVVDLPTGRGRVVTRQARALVPLFANDVTEVLLEGLAVRRGTAEVSMRWNGVAAGTATFDALVTTRSYRPPPGAVRVWENEVEFLVRGAPAGLVRMRFVPPARVPERF